MPAQVALMFLTRGVLHHEAAWALWFAAARGLVPAAAVRARGCAPPQLAALRGACGAAAGPRLLQQQHLFSVYVHVGANDAEFAGKPPPPRPSRPHRRRPPDKHARLGQLCTLISSTAYYQRGSRLPFSTLCRQANGMLRLQRSGSVRGGQRVATRTDGARACAYSPGWARAGGARCCTGSLAAPRERPRQGRVHMSTAILSYPILPYPILLTFPYPTLINPAFCAAAGFPADSLFHGTDIAERVHVRWGTFALVDATRALLRAALADRANTRFVLLSESGIPLYPPAALHQQLTAERRSRINACAVPGVRGARSPLRLFGSHAALGRISCPRAALTGVLEIQHWFYYEASGCGCLPPYAQQLLARQNRCAAPWALPARTQPALTACAQLLLKHGGLCSNTNVLESDCTRRMAGCGRTGIACTACSLLPDPGPAAGGPEPHPDPTCAGRGRTSATCTAGWARWSPTSSSGSTGARAASGAPGSGLLPGADKPWLGIHQYDERSRAYGTSVSVV